MVGQLDVELEDAVGAAHRSEERLRVELEGGDDGREVVDTPGDVGVACAKSRRWRRARTARATGRPTTPTTGPRTRTCGRTRRKGSNIGVAKPYGRTRGSSSPARAASTRRRRASRRSSATAGCSKSSCPRRTPRRNGGGSRPSTWRRARGRGAAQRPARRRRALLAATRPRTNNSQFNYNPSPPPRPPQDRRPSPGTAPSRRAWRASRSPGGRPPRPPL